jgi:hypothetical protein
MIAAAIARRMAVPFGSTLAAQFCKVRYEKLGHKDVSFGLPLILK